MVTKTNTPVVTRRKISKYCYDKLTGTFIGFLIGMSATGLVAQFFETRSIRNLWGITAKKTLVDKNTFSYLEWFISFVIGFIVFEVFTNYVKEYLDIYLPRLKVQMLRWMVKNNLHERIKNVRMQFNGKGIALFEAKQHRARASFNKSAKEPI